MKTLEIMALCGSLRAGSFNAALLRAAGRLAPPAVRVTPYLDLAGLPPYSEDEDVERAPVEVAELRSRIAAADALLISTPEYNGSLPGQLKNALDWASRPYPGNALRGRPAAVIGASTGPFGAVWAQAEVRKVLRVAGARTLETEIAVPDAVAAFDDRLELTDPAVAGQLAALLSELARGVRDPCAVT